MEESEKTLVADASSAAGGEGVNSGGGLLGLLGSLDTKALGGLLSLLGEGGEQDHRENLLRSLQPYLSPEKRGSVDKACSAYRMARTARTALKLLEK